MRTELGESPWSPSSGFELGLLAAADWSARWIEPYEPEVAPPGERPAWRLRGVFELGLEPTVTSARLYATADGVYEAFLNGQRVGDAELTPGYTEYRSRLQVQTYDVSMALRPGHNVIEVLLSDGWYRGQVGLPRAHDQWGTTLGLLAELRAGGRAVCATDDAWTSRPSEVTRADLIGGQTIDLRRACAAADADPVIVRDRDLERLVASPAPPVRRVQELRPVGVTRTGRGQVFDLGQNINGWVRLRDLGPEGTALTLVHGEALDAARDLTTTHLDVDLPFLSEPLPAGQVDRVISAGRPGEAFEPRHTTHGFRYVRVEGHPGELTADAITGVVVHTDLERTGWFECSDERINRLHEAAVWSLRGNVCDVPTDCPTRERGSWTGDWQLFVPTAAFLFDVAGFCAKWLRDLAAEQTPEGLVANLVGAVETADAFGGEGDGEKMILSSVHQAKGLEWKVVFVLWLTEGMFPSARSAETPEGLEEERRLFYVAVTRCKDELYPTYPEMRLNSGYGDAFQRPSRFLSEIPGGVVGNVGGFRTPPAPAGR